MRTLYVFLFLITFTLQAQEDAIRSLVKQINAGTLRDHKYKRCNRIVDSLLEKNDFSTCYKFLQSLHKEYDALPNDSFTPDVYYAHGDFYFASSNYNQALDQLLISDKIYKQQKRPKGSCRVLTNMGNCYYFLSNYDRALTCYNEALSINLQLIKDEEISSNLYNNIGIIYAIRRNFPMARNFFSRAMLVYLKKADSLSVGQAYNNFASVMKELGQYDSAFYYFSLARHLKEKFGTKSDISDSYSNMAGIYLKKKDPATALSYLQKSLTLLDTSLYNNDLSQIYQQFFETYDMMKNTPMAYRYYRMWRTVGDTIDAHNKSGELMQKEITIEVSKAHLADSLATVEEKKIQTLELQQQKKQNSFLIFSLVAAAGIAALLYNRFRVTRKQKHIIADQKHLVELKQKEMLDSIHYAKRIQQSLMTSEKYIERTLKEIRNKK